MELFKSNLQFSYYKFLWYKYKFLSAWDKTSTFSKCVVWLISSGTLALAYRYLKSSSTNIDQDQDQIEAVSKRRKKGNRDRPGHECRAMAV